MNVSNHTNTNGNELEGNEWELMPFNFTALSVRGAHVVAFRIFDHDGIFYDCTLDKRCKQGRYLSDVDMGSQAIRLFTAFFGGDQRYLAMDRLYLFADLLRAIAKCRKARGGVLEADFRRQDVRDIIAFIRGTNCGGM